MNQQLVTMLRALDARQATGVYAFCRLDDGRLAPAAAVSWFREAEGATVILPLEAANAAGLKSEFEAAWITLGVESPLDAVGLTAIVSGALAEAGIPCNVVAACRHDHLFVPYSQAAQALRVLAQWRAIP